MNFNRIRLDIPDPVGFVLRKLRAAGFPAYLVGGCVRDALMGRVPGDYDVTTAARPDEMLRVFADCRVVETGLKHGTLTVVREGMNVEVTTYRVDGAYSDGRRPDSVSFADRLSDDLSRRDFTVNAMAYAPGDEDGDADSPDRGLTDLFGGREDLERRVIRCVGRAEERFSEDGLRILRALRFASVLRFECDPECAAAVRSMAPMLDRISRERIYAELTKLLGGANAGDVLSSFAPVFARILPPLTEDAVTRAAEIFRKNAAESAPEIDPLPYAVRYAVLLDSLSEADAARAMDSLKPSRDEKRGVLNLLARREWRMTENARYDVLALMRDNGDDFPETLARFLRLTGRMGEEDESAIRREAASILEGDACRRTSQLAVDGRDLGAMGFRGAEIGETLRLLLDRVMRGELANEGDALLEEARRIRP